jgi:hypothetical protein
MCLCGAVLCAIAYINKWAMPLAGRPENERSGCRIVASPH